MCNNSLSVLQSIKLPTDFLLSLQTDEDLQKSVTTVSVLLSTLVSGVLLAPLVFGVLLATLVSGVLLASLLVSLFSPV